jgi:hypothetical protein
VREWAGGSERVTGGSERVTGGSERVDTAPAAPD